MCIRDSLLTSGSKVPNPQELLSSKRFKRLIEELKKEFGFIIIDLSLIHIYPVPQNLAERIIAQHKKEMEE